MFLREMKRAAAAATLAMVAASCDLAEVTTEPGDDVVVVEAVLRTDFPWQQVLLHRAIQGRFAGPVPGATVVVTGPDGAEHRLVERTSDCFRVDPAYARSDSLRVDGSCYTSGGTDTSWVRPGATYDLRVETPRGEVIRGRTHVPGDFVPSIPMSSSVGRFRTCSLAPESTLDVVWTRSPGAASYVGDLRVLGLRNAFRDSGFDVPEPLELRGLSVSETDTTLVLPTEFGLFERLELDTELLAAISHGFPEGVAADFILAAVDLNWVNSVRGGNFNPSGQIRISTVVGDGVGVFGSMTVKRTFIFVQQQSGVPRCPGA
ncbi:MAG TPA: hypothetical protein VF092_16345 [Longimicrobium sp.]